MKRYLLTFLSLIGITQLQAQCSLPPPPGYNPVYSIDMDNDGIATFDIGYYIIHQERPLMEEIHNVSSSGYNFTFYNGNNQLSGLIYTNTQPEEFCSIHYEYTGSGPVFQPLPPCFWPVPEYGSIRLIAIPFNGDKDGDGILNSDEDTNHNLNLMDDDDDNDGIINLDDVSTLALQRFAEATLKVYPNPVSDGFIYFESAEPIATISVCDLAGKLVLTSPGQSGFLKTEVLAAGVYLVKFQSENAVLFRRIVIH